MLPKPRFKGRAIGAAIGLMMACLMTLCEWMGLGEQPLAQFTPRFLGGPPAFLAWQIGHWNWLAWIFFFAYWIAIGAGFGLLLERPSGRRLILVFCFFVLLVVMHRMTQLDMASKVEMAALGLKK